MQVNIPFRPMDGTGYEFTIWGPKFAKAAQLQGSDFHQKVSSGEFHEK